MTIQSRKMQHWRGVLEKTGVHFWYYEPLEYKKLSKKQQDGLCVWRSTSEGKALIASDQKGGNKNDKFYEKLQEWATLGTMMISLGSTNASSEEFIFEKHETDVKVENI